MAPANDLLGALQYAMAKVGLRASNLPNKEETALLLSHIIREYGGHTGAEIRLAFDLALAGKLELREVSCFENFSCLYFSTIMNAYRLWAKEQYKSLHTEPDELGGQELLSDQSMAEWLRDLSEKVRAGGYPVHYIPLQLYDWLTSKKMLDPVPSTKWAYLDKALDYRQGELADLCQKENTDGNRKKLSAFIEMRAAGFLTGPETLVVKNLSKKMIVFDYAIKYAHDH
jgi:hypothetical protein